MSKLVCRETLELEGGGKKCKAEEKGEVVKEGRLHVEDKEEAIASSESVMKTVRTRVEEEMDEEHKEAVENRDPAVPTFDKKQTKTICYP